MAKLQVIQTRPHLADTAVYAPGIRVSSNADIVFLSGITALPPYPAQAEGFEMPEDIGAQTRLAMENLRSILSELGVGWQNVVKIVKLYTEGGGNDVMREYLDGWIPCSSSIGVSALSVPGAKLMLDVTVVA